MGDPEPFAVRPIGFVRSMLISRKNAPRQGSEGAPDARIDLLPEFTPAVHRLKAGDHILLLTWLHRADRDVLEVHPRDDRTSPLHGVFATRSPDRPNPIGLHRVVILAIDDRGLAVGPLEAIDGTPVIDIKPALDCAQER
jgi:tRNA-Thr(GGU) m(6)t(6)A37 methyltransferase TsaA